MNEQQIQSMYIEMCKACASNPNLKNAEEIFNCARLLLRWSWEASRDKNYIVNNETTSPSPIGNDGMIKDIPYTTVTLCLQAIFESYQREKDKNWIPISTLTSRIRKELNITKERSQDIVSKCIERKLIVKKTEHTYALNA